MTGCPACRLHAGPVCLLLLVAVEPLLGTGVLYSCYAETGKVVTGTIVYITRGQISGLILHTLICCAAMCGVTKPCPGVVCLLSVVWRHVHQRSHLRVCERVDEQQGVFREWCAEIWCAL